MALKIWELISILLAALVTGILVGPWVAITRSLHTFEPDTFLAIGHRLVANVAPVMTILMPTALLSMLPVLFFSYTHRPRTCFLFLAGFSFSIFAFLVTMLVEVPISRQVQQWTTATLPDNWQRLRDRWGVFHIARAVASITGLGLLVAGAIF